jgi:5'-nucleotidase
VSGLSIIADVNKPEGSRILSIYLSKDGNHIPITSDSKEKFTVAMVSFISEGFDGYTCFSSPDVETLIGLEGALTDTGIMLEILRSDREVGMSEEEDIQRVRARRAILVDEASMLPVVNPRVENRIVYI